MIATTTTPLTLSPMARTCLQEIEADNRRLQDLRIALRALVDNHLLLQNRLNRLSTLLDELLDELAMHFALEEADGYFGDAVETAPRLLENADQLRQEHENLFASLVDIAEEAHQVCAKGFSATHIDNLSDQIHGFDARLSEHEERETRLVIEAMNLDIGGEG